MVMSLPIILSNGKPGKDGHKVVMMLPANTVPLHYGSAKELIETGLSLETIALAIGNLTKQYSIEQTSKSKKQKSIDGVLFNLEAEQYKRLLEYVPDSVYLIANQNGGTSIEAVLIAFTAEEYFHAVREEMKRDERERFFTNDNSFYLFLKSWSEDNPGEEFVFFYQVAKQGGVLNHTDAIHHLHDYAERHIAAKLNKPYHILADRLVGHTDKYSPYNIENRASLRLMEHRGMDIYDYLITPTGFIWEIRTMRIDPTKFSKE